MEKLRFSVPLCIAIWLLLVFVFHRSGSFERPKWFKSLSLAQHVQIDGVLRHLKNLETIALSHPNHSRSVLNAFNQSASYVMELLKTQTDCELSTIPVKVPVWEQYKPPEFAISYSGHEFKLQPDTDYRLMRYGGKSANLTRIHSVFIQSTGCGMDDFVNVAGSAVLIELNTANCSVYDVSLNAEKSGAVAVLFFNPFSRTPLSNARVRTTNWIPTDQMVSVPAFSVSHAVGQLLKSQQATAKLSIQTFTGYTVADSFNIICDTREGDPNTIAMFGAHLDSVPEGPGMVDNASGSSAILEVFLSIYRTGLNKRLKNKLRFAWWTGEELGLLGSRHYCRSLEQNATEFKKLVFYSNHDMLASPNYVPYIHRGSSAPEGIRHISEGLQRLYETYFLENIPGSSKLSNYALDDMSGGSDYYSFLEVGIPTAGLATGAGALKTADERRIHGGLANAPKDPCYHQKCDDYANLSPAVLEVMTKSLAYVAETTGTKENLREWMIAGRTGHYS